MDYDEVLQLPDVLDAMGLVPRELDGVHLAVERPPAVGPDGKAELVLLVQGAFQGATGVLLRLQGLPADDVTPEPASPTVELGDGEVRRVRWPVRVGPDVARLSVAVKATWPEEKKRIRPAWKLVDTYEQEALPAVSAAGFSSELDSAGHKQSFLTRVQKRPAAPERLVLEVKRGIAVAEARPFATEKVWDPSMAPPTDTGPVPLPTLRPEVPRADFWHVPKTEIGELPVGWDDIPRTTVQAMGWDDASKTELGAPTPIPPRPAPATELQPVPWDAAPKTELAPVPRPAVVAEGDLPDLSDDAGAEPTAFAAPHRGVLKEPIAWKPCIECGADVNVDRVRELGACPQCGAAWI